MENYKLIFDPVSQENICVKKQSNGLIIPIHESNTDYQEYLKWVAEGNTPAPADE
jgi:hypothetical protein